MNSLAITYIIITFIVFYIIMMINKEKPIYIKAIYLLAFFIPYASINFYLKYGDIFTAIILVAPCLFISGLSIQSYKDIILPIFKWCGKFIKNNK